METNIKNQEIFDNYLKEKLSDLEKLEFEKQLIQNPDLSMEFRLYKMISEEIVERASFFRIMTKAEENIKTQTQLVYYSVSIAASLIILVTLGIWQPTKFSKKKIIETYAYDINYREKSILNNDFNTRSITFSIDEFLPQEKSTLAKATELYENKEYELAAIEFEKISNLINKNYELSMIMAISQLKAGKTLIASQNFEYLSNLPKYKNRELALYYLALSKIQAGDLFEARKILRLLQRSNSDCAVKAEEILSKMRYF